MFGIDLQDVSQLYLGLVIILLLDIGLAFFKILGLAALCSSTTGHNQGGKHNQHEIRKRFLHFHSLLRNRLDSITDQSGSNYTNRVELWQSNRASPRGLRPARHRLNQAPLTSTRGTPVRPAPPTPKYSRHSAYRACASR